MEFVNWFWYSCHGAHKFQEAMIPTEVSSVEVQLYPLTLCIKTELYCQLNNFYKTQ